MDIRVLRYFLALANTETISGAAQILHTTQPNLSRQLSELEKEVGRQLFIRGSRKITLTEEGMFLRKRAQEIVDLLDKTEQDFSCFDEVLGGEVYIGGGESHTMRTIARTIKRLQADYPQIHYHLLSGYSYDIIEYLDKGLLDFGVLIEPVDLTKYDHIRLPLTNTWGLMMRKDHPLAAYSSIRPEQLQQYPLMCSNQMIKENGLSGWLGYDSKKLNIVATFNLINTPALLVEEGVGCAFSFEHLINLSGDSDLCFRPLSPKLTSDSYVVWKKYQIFSKPAKKFLEVLQAELE